MIELTCEQKGCFKSDLHTLKVVFNKDKSVNYKESKVVCLHCGHEINIAEPMKKVMYQQKQIKRDEKDDGKLELNCAACKKVDRPAILEVVVQKDGVTKKVRKVVCQHCKAPDTRLTRFFLPIIEVMSGITFFREEAGAVVDTKGPVPAKKGKVARVS
jgi:hypothetical protein